MLALAEPVDLAPEDVTGLVTWAQGEEIDLTVVGPEVPLALGIADQFQRRGLPLFGPSSAAARIEASKAHAKVLMARAGVPTAEYATFCHLPEAEAYLRSRGAPIVVKASGLAAGKGAVVCMTETEALEAAREMLSGGSLGDAGREIVIESFMAGDEVSVFGITDGRDVRILPISQDHKRIGEGDTGPNTGGMGAYTPVPDVDGAFMDAVRDRIFLPVLDVMEQAATPFRGLLYAGLMRTPEGPKVVEFNARFGDPETQVVLPMLEGPLLDMLVAVARGGSLAGFPPPTPRTGAALNTVLAAGGYPDRYEKGHPIVIPDDLHDPEHGCLLFHAGTARSETGDVVTAGGRVLSVVGLGADLAEAQARSLAGVQRITFPDMTFRRDIGWRALTRKAPD
jgi:phosphoribosylamine--glycine ligase